VKRFLVLLESFDQLDKRRRALANIDRLKAPPRDSLRDRIRAGRPRSANGRCLG